MASLAGDGQAAAPAIHITPVSPMDTSRAVPTEPPIELRDLSSNSDADAARLEMGTPSKATGKERPRTAVDSESRVSADGGKTAGEHTISLPAIAQQPGKRRRRKSKHIAFKVATASDDEADRDRRGSASTTGRRPSQPSAYERRESRDVPKSSPTSEKIQDEQQKTKQPSKNQAFLDKLMQHELLAWVKPQLSIRAIKPVLRIALAMWIGYLFMIIVPVGQALGPAAFLVLISACMMPPSQPFVQVVEIMFNLFFYLTFSWAWCDLAIFAAHKVRIPTDPAVIAAAMARYADLSPTQRDFKVMTDATYLQAKPSVICAVFLCVGTALLLWWKMLTAPSPATFPLVLSCILMDVTLTMTPLYPIPNYRQPWMVYKPLAVQAGIATLCSILVFPQSASSQFRSRFSGVLEPLAKGMGQIEELFGDATSMTSFGTGHNGDMNGDSDIVFEPMVDVESKISRWTERSEAIRSTLIASLAGMAPMQAQQRYLDVDISYGRLSGKDLKSMFNLLASVQTRASGMSFFFNAIVNKVRRTHLDSAAWSAHRTMSMVSMSMSRQASNIGSRPTSRRGSFSELPRPANRGVGDITPDRRPSSPGTPATSDDEGDHTPHSRHERGRSEGRLARRLMQLHHSAPSSREHSTDRDSKGGERSTSRERRHSKDKRRTKDFHLPFVTGSNKGSHVSLLDKLHKAQQPVGVYESQRYMDVERGDERDLERVIDQLELLSIGALPLVKALRRALESTATWTHTSDHKRHDHLRDMMALLGQLKVMQDEFKEHRAEVIRPYRHLFDPSHRREHGSLSRVQHNGLYYCFVAQYHLIEFTDAVINFMEEVNARDSKRQKRRLWVPNPISLFRQFRQSVRKVQDDSHEDGEDSSGFEHEEEMDDYYHLGEVKRRNPDYEPFNNTGLALISGMSKIPDILFSRSAMFAVKAGVLSCLTSLPAYLSNSASFYYNYRGLWVTVMAQMTLAVFAGDTFTSWLARMMASFWGGIVGIIAWYVGSGSGHGNPYGLGVVTAIIFPPMMFFRMYWPGPPLTSVVFTTSVNLVIGYSYLNGHLFRLTPTKWGFEVAWLRFVCVVIGITAAWIFSLVPPSYSAKRAIRNSYARSISTVGHILCETLSAANDPHNQADMTFNQHVRAELLSTRAKLAKLGARHGAAQKEISIRGRWPDKAYKGLQATLVDTMSLLAQFNHLLPQMSPGWRKALLLRTRMCDPLFLGDVLAVISMTSSALRAGTPLPQITPGPLIAKYHMNRYKGLDLPNDPAEHDDDIPALVTAEVLEGDEYMRYALGVSIIYALMSRLDSIVVVCKTLLGENYHIANLRVSDTLPIV